MGHVSNCVSSLNYLMLISVRIYSITFYCLVVFFIEKHFIFRLSTFSLMTFLGFWREAAMMVFQDHHLGFILYGICWPYRLWIISNHHNVLENLIFSVFRKYFFEKPLMVPSTFLDLGVMIIYSKMIRKVDFRAARTYIGNLIAESIFFYSIQHLS